MELLLTMFLPARIASAAMSAQPPIARISTSSGVGRVAERYRVAVTSSVKNIIDASIKAKA